MKIVYQNRTGLMVPCTGVCPPHVEGVHMTIPAKEALEKAGHVVRNASFDPNNPVCDVTLNPRPLPRLVAAIRLDFGEKQVVLRLPCEPPWPGEEAGLENWLTAEWLPCPKCRAPVVWYEANFVPGYRICTGRKHHHSLVIQEAKK